MIKQILSGMALGTFLTIAGFAHAQQIEAVHSLDYDSDSQAQAALDSLFEDDAMRGSRATLYATDFGDSGSSHLVVEDFEDYDEYMGRFQRRVDSHGWARYLLQTPDAEYHGSNLISVIDDHGAPRHTAGYLVAYLIHTTDAATYRSAIADLNDAIGNPGVLRLVALRSGRRTVTHAVLIGGADFAAVNEYIDKLYASNAFEEFVDTVGDIREVVGIDMYRRVATWGD